MAQLIDDTSGNVLGERSTYVYTSDTGTQYNIELDNSVSGAVGNILSTNAALDGLAASGTLPLRPRYINVVATNDDNIRKRIIVTSPTNGLFIGTISTTTINGVGFTVLSSRGEQRPRFRVSTPPE